MCVIRVASYLKLISWKFGKQNYIDGGFNANINFLIKMTFKYAVLVLEIVLVSLLISTLALLWYLFFVIVVEINFFKLKWCCWRREYHLFY